MPFKDINYISIGLIPMGKRALIPIEPLYASVSFDESDSLYRAEIESLGLACHAVNQALLKTVFEDYIAVLWSRYACAPDEKLTRAARVLKSRLKAAFREDFHWQPAKDEHGKGVRYVPTADIDTWRAELAKEFAAKEEGDDDATSDKSGS